MATSSGLKSARVDPAIRRRILAEARRQFLARGFRAVTMDELAAELGMSKKTLYVAFSTKSALVEAMLEAKFRQLDRDLQAVLDVASDPFPVLLAKLLACLKRAVDEIQPPLVEDLRSAPRLFRRLETERRRIIQRHFGRLFAEGQRAALVRRDLPPELIVEMLLALVQGLLHPRQLSRLGLTPARGLAAVLNLMFEGVLTSGARSGQ